MGGVKGSTPDWTLSDPSGPAGTMALKPVGAFAQGRDITVTEHGLVNSRSCDLQDRLLQLLFQHHVGRWRRCVIVGVLRWWASCTRRQCRMRDVVVNRKTKHQRAMLSPISLQWAAVAETRRSSEARVEEMLAWSRRIVLIKAFDNMSLPCCAENCSALAVQCEMMRGTAGACLHTLQKVGRLEACTAASCKFLHHRNRNRICHSFALWNEVTAEAAMNPPVVTIFVQAVQKKRAHFILRQWWKMVYVRSVVKTVGKLVDNRVSALVSSSPSSSQLSKCATISSWFSGYDGNFEHVAKDERSLSPFGRYECDDFNPNSSPSTTFSSNLSSVADTFGDEFCSGTFESGCSSRAASSDYSHQNTRLWKSDTSRCMSPFPDCLSEEDQEGEPTFECDVDPAATSTSADILPSSMSSTGDDCNTDEMTCTVGNQQYTRAERCLQVMRAQLCELEGVTAAFSNACARVCRVDMSQSAHSSVDVEEPSVASAVQDRDSPMWGSPVLLVQRQKLDLGVHQRCAVVQTAPVPEAIKELRPQRDSHSPTTISFEVATPRKTVEQMRANATYTLTENPFISKSSSNQTPNMAKASAAVVDMHVVSHAACVENPLASKSSSKTSEGGVVDSDSTSWLAGLENPHSSKPTIKAAVQRTSFLADKATSPLVKQDERRFLNEGDPCSMPKKSVVSDVQSGLTMLMQASKKGDVDRVNDLLHRGADIRHPCNTNNWTCLHYACFYGHASVVAMLLLEDGAKTLISHANQEDSSCLLLAVLQGHLEVVRCLLATDAGESEVARIRSKDGYTLLHLAAMNGHFDIMRTLLTTRAGRQLSAVKDQYGRTAACIAREVRDDAAGGQSDRKVEMQTLQNKFGMYVQKDFRHGRKASVESVSSLVIPRGSLESIRSGVMNMFSHKRAPGCSDGGDRKKATVSVM